MSVPEDLRDVLEQCLAEDASPENLELYLPTVRAIITSLLQGLRGKQSTYRQIVSSSRHRSDQSGQDRESTRSSRSGGTRGHRSQLSRTIAENEGVAAERGSVSRRSAQTSGRRRIPEQINEPPPRPPPEEPFIGGFVQTRERGPSPGSTSSTKSGKSASQSHRRLSSPRRSATAEFPFTTPRSDPPSTEDDPFMALPAINATPPEQEEQPQPIHSPPQPQVPASVKRYSLVDNPAPSSPSPPTVTVDSPPTAGFNHDTNGTASSPPQTPPPPDPQHLPAMANSLAALKKSDALERRASKRFSTYNISKMTGSSTRERPARGQSNRRSLVASNAPLTAGELAVLTEVDDEEEAPKVQRYGSPGTKGSRPTTPIPEEEAPPPVRPFPGSTSAPEQAEPPGIAASAHLKAAKAALETSTRSSGTSFPVFLQLGREVKKVTMEPGLSFSSLRVMFVDKFAYNPGLENFPAIYIRDPSSGVQYELEDVDEVKEKCLLSLNIERKLPVVSTTTAAHASDSSGSDQAAHRFADLNSIAGYQRIANCSH
jgi:Actin interacting protein 3